MNPLGPHLVAVAVLLAGSFAFVHTVTVGAGVNSRSAVASDGAVNSRDAIADPAVEPIAVVERFSKALAVGDSIGASVLLDANVLIYEGGAVERSRQEYAAHHLGADAAFLKSIKYQRLSRTSRAAADLAWVATEARLTPKSGKADAVISTETMILRKTASGWRIVHIHWSSRTEQGI